MDLRRSHLSWSHGLIWPRKWRIFCMKSRTRKGRIFEHLIFSWDVTYLSDDPWLIKQCITQQLQHWFCDLSNTLPLPIKTTRVGNLHDGPWHPSINFGFLLFPSSTKKNQVDFFHCKKWSAMFFFFFAYNCFSFFSCKKFVILCWGFFCNTTHSPKIRFMMKFSRKLRDPSLSVLKASKLAPFQQIIMFRRCIKSQLDMHQSRQLFWTVIMLPTTFYDVITYVLNAKTVSKSLLRNVGTTHKAATTIMLS